MDIARQAGCSRAFVHKRLERFGIRTRTPKQGHDLAVANGKIRQIPIDEDFFATWSAASAWVFGLLWTDGHITRPTVLATGANNTPGFSFSQRERELVEKMRALIGPELRITFRPQRKYGSVTAGAVYTLEVRNTAIYPRLLRVGLMPKKSLKVGFPSVPQSSLRHFVRGCWDGDGSVYISGGRLRASFVSGSEAFVRGVKDALVRLGLHDRTIHVDSTRKNSVFYIVVAGIDDLCRLRRAFYENVAPSQYYERKKLVFDRFFADHPWLESGAHEQSSVF